MYPMSDLYLKFFPNSKKILICYTVHTENFVIVRTEKKFYTLAKNFFNRIVTL